MRIMLIFLIVFTLAAHAKSRGQTITYSADKAPLKEVFRAIRQQTGYGLLGNEHVIKKATSISIHAKGMHLIQFLDQVLIGQPIGYRIEENNIFLFARPKGHTLLSSLTEKIRMPIQHDVRIHVTDSIGGPLAGASVVVKDSKRGGQTDLNGNLIIKNIKDEDVLVISYIGYKTKETIAGNESALTITLIQKTNELTGMDVVVNTGYQSLPKERATGSFELVNNKALNQQVSTDILSRLKGTSSVLFDDGTGRPPLTIRGLSSINGDKAPLIVLNNFPYEGDIHNINPNDIESITILKDAAAASIWGTRASNGVIVITTKQAKYDQPMRISLNSNVKISDQPNLDYIRQISSSDYIDVEKFLFEKGFRYSDTANLLKPAFSPAYEILFKERNGQLSHVAAENELDKLKGLSVFDDFNKYIYSSQVLQQYALNIDGGSQKDAYHIATSFDKQINDLKAKYDRITLHLENTIRPVNALQIKTSLIYNRTNTSSGKPSYDNLRMGLYPYAQFANTDGTPLAINKTYRRPYIDTVGSGKLLDWKYYPLEDYKHNRSTETSEDLVGNLDIQFQPIDALKFILQYQYERQEQSSRKLMDEQSFFTRDLINKFSQIDPITGQVDYQVPIGSILDRGNAIMESQSLRGQIDFHQSFGENDLTVLVGSELRNINNDNAVNRIYGYNDQMLTYGVVDLKHAYPTIIPGYDLYIPDATDVEETNNRFVSVFANGAYSYKERYILSASARRDASNLFGVNTNDKWTPLWSIGGSWIINKESFWKSSFVRYLKLRSTYGFSGNVDQSKSAVTTIRYSPNDRYTNFNAASISQFANPDLRWEKTGMLNIGLDFALKGDLLSGSIEYYQKKGKDLFGYAPVDWTATGQNSLLYNVANMNGHGWDILLSSTPVKKQIKWETSFRASISKTKVTKYFASKTISSAFVNNGMTINPLVGYPVYGIVSYKWAGLDAETGDPMGYLNGEKSSDYNGTFNQDYTALIFSGSATPTFYGSLLNTFSYKNFSLSANIIYRMGYYYRKPSIDYSALFTNGYGDVDFYSRWQKQGDEQFTTVPSMVYPADSRRDLFYNSSDILSEKADNVRLQYISLSYYLGNTALRKLPVNNLVLTVMLNNVGILWRSGDKDIDPDYPNSMSPLRSISLGIKINF